MRDENTCKSVTGSDEKVGILRLRKNKDSYYVVYNIQNQLCNIFKISK